MHRQNIATHCNTLQHTVLVAGRHGQAHQRQEEEEGEEEGKEVVGAAVPGQTAGVVLIMLQRVAVCCSV